MTKRANTGNRTTLAEFQGKSASTAGKGGKNTMTTATKTETPKAEPKAKAEPAKAAPCLCGCGDVPFSAKSKFIPGHDARLKGRIIKFLTAKANDATYNAEKFGPAPTAEQMAYAQEKWAHLIDFSGVKYKKVEAEKAAKPKSAVPDEAKVKKAAK